VQLALLQHHRQPLQRHQALQQAGQRPCCPAASVAALRQRAIAQPTDSMVSHCAPLRITPSVSAR
jgi:hypothetical protein